VRYVREHFWSSGYHSETCLLIFETWNAHLLKARTWALDAEGRKLPIADLLKAASIQPRIPYDLTEFERASFFGKQSALDRLGVTELLAVVISSLSHDLSESGLPNAAIGLFNELLNGGNESAQDTLYSYLVHVDTQGKFVAHIAQRLDKALEGIVAARKNMHLGKEETDSSVDDADDCEHAICTVRFLQLLCEGGGQVCFLCCSPLQACLFSARSHTSSNYLSLKQATIKGFRTTCEGTRWISSRRSATSSSLSASQPSWSPNFPSSSWSWWRSC
jgi:hypothetical protein